MGARGFVYSLGDKGYSPERIDRAEGDEKKEFRNIHTLISAYHSFGLMIERKQLPRWIFKKTATGTSIIRTYEILEPYIIYRRVDPGYPSPMYANHFEDLYKMVKKHLKTPEKLLEAHCRNRTYNDHTVCAEVLNEIIMAGNQAPSDSTGRDVLYKILQGTEIGAFEDQLMKRYKKLAAAPSGKPLNTEIGSLLHNAPAVVILTSESEANARMAYQYMRWKAKEKGVGIFRADLFTALVNKDKDLLIKLEVEKVCICFEIGCTEEITYTPVCVRPVTSKAANDGSE